MTPLEKLAIFATGCWVIVLFCVSPKGPPIILMVPFLALASGRFLIFHVLSYRVTDDWIFVHRSWWDVPLPRKKLLMATHDPTAFDDRDMPSNSSIRWIYYGSFSSRRLGRFHSFVSDPRNAVILRFSDQIVVVSPENPQVFMAALNVPCGANLAPLSQSTGGGYFSGYW